MGIFLGGGTLFIKLLWMKMIPSCEVSSNNQFLIKAITAL